MSRAPQRRRVVHAVAGHGHELALVLQGLHNLDLLLGRERAVHAHALDVRLEFGHVHARQFASSNHLAAIRDDAEPLRDEGAPSPDDHP